MSPGLESPSHILHALVVSVHCVYIIMYSLTVTLTLHLYRSQTTHTDHVMIINEVLVALIVSVCVKELISWGTVSVRRQGYIHDTYIHHRYL